MTQVLAHPQFVKPEHRIFWNARVDGEPPITATLLKKFFVRYARAHPRPLPWRAPGTSSFELLIAELLLVQTKAEDVAEVWRELIKRYPSADRLARAQTRSLTTFLRPLGLQNQRARALKVLSRAVVERFDGRLPRSIPDLLSLPHIGLYVACAVACFSYGERVPIVDANVLRVFGRIAGIDPGRELRRSPKVWNAAWGILPRKNDCILHNYGVLDFAAKICKARLPLCQSCALNKVCAYARTRKVVRDEGEVMERRSRAIPGQK
jgi:A/G-specific adenine glycosylase